MVALGAPLHARPGCRVVPALPYGLGRSGSLARAPGALLSCRVMADGEGMVALLAGASGLAGGYALDALLEAPDVRRVVAVSRRPLRREHSPLAPPPPPLSPLQAPLPGTPL